MSTHNTHGESMETVVARIDENVCAMRREYNATRDDHEKRIRGLEKWQWKIIGAGALITAAAGVYEAFHH